MLLGHLDERLSVMSEISVVWIVQHEARIHVEFLVRDPPNTGTEKKTTEKDLEGEGSLREDFLFANVRKLEAVECGTMLPSNWFLR